MLYWKPFLSIVVQDERKVDLRTEDDFPRVHIDSKFFGRDLRGVVPDMLHWLCWLISEEKEEERKKKIKALLLNKNPLLPPSLSFSIAAMSLLSLPFETLAEIAHYTGWDPEFQRSCKQVASCYSGPVYNCEIQIPKFYTLLRERWRGVKRDMGPYRGWEDKIVERSTFHPEYMTIKEETIAVDVSRLHNNHPTHVVLSRAWRYIRFQMPDILFKKTSSQSLLISGIRLQSPRKELHSVIFNLNFASLVTMTGTFLKLLQKREDGTIPLFSSLMPIALKEMSNENSILVAFRSQPGEQDEELIRGWKIYIDLCTWKESVPFPPFPFPRYIVRTGEVGFPFTPNGWIFKVPDSIPHAHCMDALHFWIQFDREEIVPVVLRLNHWGKDGLSPFPFDPSRHVFIPPWNLNRGVKYGRGRWDISYSIHFTLKDNPTPQQFKYEDIYYLVDVKPLDMKSIAGHFSLD